MGRRDMAVRRRRFLTAASALTVGLTGCLRLTGDEVATPTTGERDATAETERTAGEESTTTDAAETEALVSIETVGTERIAQIFVDSRNRMYQQGVTAPTSEPRRGLARQLDVPYYGRIGRGPLLDGERLFLRPDPRTLVALSRADGSVVWNFSETSTDAYPLPRLVALYGETVVIVGENRRTDETDVVGIKADTGREAWTATLPLGEEEYVSAAKRAGDTVVVCTDVSSDGDSGSHIYAVDLVEKAVDWESRLAATAITPEDVALTSERAFITTDEAPDGEPNVVAFDLDAQERLWDATLDIGEAVPTVDGRHLYLPVTTGDVGGHLIAFSQEDGTESWRFEQRDLPRTGVSTDGENVYTVGSSRLYALSATDGSVSWSYVDETSDSLSANSSTMPVVTENLLLTGADAGSENSAAIRAIDTSNGDRRWQHRVPHSSVTSPVIADGVLWIIGFDRQDDSATLYALGEA